MMSMTSLQSIEGAFTSIVQATFGELNCSVTVKVYQKYLGEPVKWGSPLNQRKKERSCLIFDVHVTRKPVSSKEVHGYEYGSARRSKDVIAALRPAAKYVSQFSQENDAGAQGPCYGQTSLCVYVTLSDYRLQGVGASMKGLDPTEAGFIRPRVGGFMEFFAHTISNDPDTQTVDLYQEAREKLASPQRVPLFLLEPEVSRSVKGKTSSQEKRGSVRIFGFRPRHEGPRWYAIKTD